MVRSPLTTNTTIFYNRFTLLVLLHLCLLLAATFSSVELEGLLREVGLYGELLLLFDLEAPVE